MIDLDGERDCGDGHEAARAREHALERGDAARVEGTAGLPAQQLERLLVAPRVAVHTTGEERIVNVADREDSRRDAELLAAGAVRVAGTVEPLVVVADEAAHPAREGELAEERVAPEQIG